MNVFALNAALALAWAALVGSFTLPSLLVGALGGAAPFRPNRLL